MGILITGASSGFGACIKSLINQAEVLKRDASTNYYEMPTVKKKIDVIWHNGYRPCKSKEDILFNLDLLKQLVSMKPNKFIFASSVDVISSDSYYAEMKRQSEDFIKKNLPCYLILRMTAQVSANMRKNHLHLIKTNGELTLAANSRFSYVRSKDIVRFVAEKYLERNCFRAVENVPATDTISLEQVASFFSTTPKFGRFTYDCALPSVSEGWREYIKSSNVAISEYLKN